MGAQPSVNKIASVPRSHMGEASRYPTPSRNHTPLRNASKSPIVTKQRQQDLTVANTSIMGKKVSIA